MRNPPGINSLSLSRTPVSSCFFLFLYLTIFVSSFIRCCTCLQAPLLPARAVLPRTASCQSARRGGEGWGFFLPADVNNPVLKQLQSFTSGLEVGYRGTPS